MQRTLHCFVLAGLAHLCGCDALYPKTDAFDWETLTSQNTAVEEDFAPTFGSDVSGFVDGIWVEPGADEGSHSATPANADVPEDDADTPSVEPRDNAPVTCTPQCQEKECGDDGCGGLCGVCEGVFSSCYVGVCENAPAQMAFSRTEISMSPVTPGETAFSSFEILNLGGSPLEVFGVQWSGAAGFRLKIEDMEVVSDSPSSSFDTPVIIPASGSVFVEVIRQSSSKGVAAAEATFLTNPASEVSESTVHFTAQVFDPELPCVTAATYNVDMGTHPSGVVAIGVVELTACGSQPVTVHSAELVQEDGLAFDWLYMPALPLVIEPGETWRGDIVFHAPQESGEYAAVVIVGTDGSSSGNMIVNVHAATSKMPCPVPVIEGDIPATIGPMTTLVLDGSSSQESGNLSSYYWSVLSPSGVQIAFAPSAYTPVTEVTFPVVGDYTVRLTVVDASGQASCVAAERKVSVRPDADLHVELHWDVPHPTGPDEALGMGMDVDLHMTRGLMGGADFDLDGDPDGWFSQPYDCFWFNPNPEGVSHGQMPAANPQLLIDEGPDGHLAVMRLETPEEGMSYRIAAHGWQDHGHEESLVSVRIYIRGQLVFQAFEQPLRQGDLWEIASVTWPSGTVSPDLSDEGGAKVLSNYENPDFPTP